MFMSREIAIALAIRASFAARHSPLGTLAEANGGLPKRTSGVSSRFHLSD